MIDIYDEVGYVKVVLEKGLSQRWERDAALLTRFYKFEGKKKREVKEILKEKCERYVPGYNKFITYKRLNKIIDSAWKDKTVLREIRAIVFPKEVLNWFLNLENIELTQERVDELKEKRPQLSIKKNVMNFNRIKFLFTLFIWTKVQENYLDKPDVHYLNNYIKKFREDAFLPASFNMKQERNLLYDLGYIHINYGLGVIAKFMENPVFKTEITDKNKVVISGEDIKNCGYWLAKQKYGSFVCQNCGKEFCLKGYKSVKTGRKPKYCFECAEILRNDNTNLIRKTCISCGKGILVPQKFYSKVRCDRCQEEYRRKYKTEKQKIYRENTFCGHETPKNSEPANPCTPMDTEVF